MGVRVVVFPCGEVVKAGDGRLHDAPRQILTTCGRKRVTAASKLGKTCVIGDGLTSDLTFRVGNDPSECGRWPLLLVRYDTWESCRREDVFAVLAFEQPAMTIPCPSPWPRCQFPNKEGAGRAENPAPDL